MKNFTARRIVSFVLVLAFMLSFLQPMHVNAAEPDAPTAEDFGEPISVTTYEDAELGCTVTEKIYFLPDKNTRSKSGSGTYRNEKTFEWTSGAVSTYYAQGYFTWGDGKVSVTNAVGGIVDVPSQCSVSNENLKTGTGKYAYIFNDFAYVTYSCTVTSIWGLNSDLSVTIRISESGNAI